MSRPKNIRKVFNVPETNYFKPRGIPVGELEEVTLSFEELEAIRLTDFDGMYQEQAAEKMGVSRQTLGRIVESAHRIIADAILNGKAIKIDGGSYIIGKSNKPKCRKCRNNFILTENMTGKHNCPRCHKFKNQKDNLKEN